MNYTIPQMVIHLTGSPLTDNFALLGPRGKPILSGWFGQGW